MSRFSTTVLLCLPPVAIVWVIIWLVGFIAAFRRSFGAQSEIPVGAVAGAVILLVLHAGYFAAPWLVHTGRSGLALVLVTPRPMDPFIADRSLLPAMPGAGTMPTLPATLLSAGLLAMLYI